MLELDHVFICISDELNVTHALTEFGLNLSSRQIHKGQGTANRCAFFDNAYLELLLRDSDRDLQSKQVEAVSLWERMRWKNTNASPFGVSFRFTETKQNIPVATTPYDAPFLPKGITIPVATPQDSIHEPLIFFSLVEAPSEQNLPDRSLLKHRGSQHKITGLKITTPFSERSQQLQWFSDRNLISVRVGNEHHVELELDGGKTQQIANFNLLPLSIKW